MLGDYTICPVLATKDMEKAREFYESTLGLEVVRDQPHEVLYSSGNSWLSVYRSDFAGTNLATAATWEVDDLDGLVRELQGHNVTFEHYDLEGMMRVGDIHSMNGERAAWFKDPDGNILCLHEGEEATMDDDEEE